jgi:hypothetical protein
MLHITVHPRFTLINYHKHLFNCERNAAIKAACVACKWDEWQRTSRRPPSVMGKTFEQLLTTDDAKLLHEMLITY